MLKKLRTDNKPLTKKAFEQLLRKAAQPLPKKQLDLKETETSVAHPSDGYICQGIIMY